MTRRHNVGSPIGDSHTGQMDGGAYGAGKATGRAFDVLTFIRKPQVILRAVSWVSILSVFLGELTVYSSVHYQYVGHSVR